MLPAGALKILQLKLKGSRLSFNWSILSVLQLRIFQHYWINCIHHVADIAQCIGYRCFHGNHSHRNIGRQAIQQAIINDKANDVDTRGGNAERWDSVESIKAD